MPPAPQAHERQRAACRALARDFGLDVTRNYSDEAGVPLELAWLLADALAGELTVLVVARLDRLGRTISAAPLVLAELEASGVAVYAVDRGGVRPISDRGALADILAAAIRPWTCRSYVTR
ncbi:recombinase family protein [Enemella evansiae]|uniref:recombinase family protein n=1 Tax=Enemella evansiae TaxID=2016499 RepID=UPI00105E3852|nr:recombinase family protein [Enemella evansiae]TDO92388.1 resolvase-like protein [Enemella evansiae]